jgi:phage shock protein E
MIWKIGISVLVVGVLGYVFFLPRTEKEKKDFDPETSYYLVENGAVLIDVRSKGEYDSGYVEGAVHIPHYDIKNQKDLIEKLTKNDKSASIVVYCQSGSRSGVAKIELEKMGYKNVVNHGGIGSWKK